MPRARKLIDVSEAADRLGCHAKTIKRGAYGLKLHPKNPFVKNPHWMVEELAVREIEEQRLRQGKEA